MPTNEEIAQTLREKAGLSAEPQPIVGPDPDAPEDELEPVTPDGDSEVADDPLAERRLALDQREKDLEERAKNMERGFQKAMQKAAAERKAFKDGSKVTREVQYLANAMGENTEFARDFQTLAAQYGIRMPDVTRDDIREEMEAVKEELLERMEQEKYEERKKAYEVVIETEEERLVQRHKLKPADLKAITGILNDPDLPLLRAGMSPAQVRKAYDSAAATYLLPRSDRRPLSRDAVTRAKSAAGLASSPPVPSRGPLRATSFNESSEDVLRKLGFAGKK